MVDLTLVKAALFDLYSQRFADVSEDDNETDDLIISDIMAAREVIKLATLLEEETNGRT